MITNLDSLFNALADPTRRAIVERLSAGEATVGELAEPFDMSVAAVSKHLSILDRSGLVTRVREGRVTRCRLDPGGLAEVQAWAARHHRFWNERLGRLESLVEEMEAER